MRMKMNCSMKYCLSWMKYCWNYCYLKMMMTSSVRMMNLTVTMMSCYCYSMMRRMNSENCYCLKSSCWMMRKKNSTSWMSWKYCCWMTTETMSYYWMIPN